MLKDDKCFKCGLPTICTEHTYDDMWVIRCVSCGVTTEKYKSLEDAIMAWDKLKGEPTNE